MIKLYDICSKLEGLLNGTDAEITGTSPVTNKYFFKVYSEGLYLTTIADKTKGKNFIPVIVGALGGEINPVPELGEVDYNVAVQLFFPVRFKDDFYALNDFLVENFVGKTLTYGTVKALSNISVAQYGELQNLNLKEYNEWIVNTYKVQNEYVGKFMSMTFTLYLSTAKNLNQANGFLYGNEWKTEISLKTIINNQMVTDQTVTQDAELSVELETLGIPVVDSQELLKVELWTAGQWVDYLSSFTNPRIEIASNKLVFKGTWTSSSGSKKFRFTYSYKSTYLLDDDPAFITETDISQSEPNSQQILGETSAKSLPTITSYVKDLPIYIKNNTEYQNLIKNYLNREIQEVKVIITEKCPTLLGSGYSISHEYFLTTLSFVKGKGDLLGVTLSLAERLDL